jgi:peptidylprolyl isomerase
MKSLKTITITSAASLIAATTLSAMAAAPAPAASSTGSSGPAVARMGSVSVPQSELEQMLRSVPDSTRAQIKSNRASLEKWLRDRIASEALLKEAASKNWADRPEIRAQIESDTREIVGQSYLASVSKLPDGYPSDAEMQTAYNQDKSAFAVPATYRVAQIFLVAPAGDDATIAKVRQQATALAVQARSGDFAALAKVQSQDTRSANNGGEVGVMPLAQMVPEIRDTVAKLQPGQVADPVQSSTGFHIVKLLDMQPAHTATFDEVKPRLQLAMRQRRQQELAQAYMDGMVKPGAVTIDNAAVDAALKKVN